MMASRKRILKEEETNLESKIVADENTKIENENESVNSIGHSGNSDVDIKVEVNVDTTAIGFAILSSLLATGKMSYEEFKKAVEKFEELTNGSIATFSGRDANNPTNVLLLNPKR